MDAPLIASVFDAFGKVGLQSSIRPVDAAVFELLALMESEDRRPITVTGFVP